MSGVLLLSLMKTSKRTDYVLSLIVTLFAAGVTVWVALELGPGWGALSMALVTLFLAGTTGYAWWRWKSEEAAALQRRSPGLRAGGVR